ncbi:unnamed protein product [Lactuca saligna]|uniref:FBD domain-containing protein n=1 Tax=Lactuca saligna TaxID=75948 RepID=A0AA35YRY7_LACSI|nr:unnamed protein product [Lactuca saligna]
MLGSNFVMEDLSLLVEAAVFFRDKTFKYRNPINLLKGISGAKSLSLFHLSPHVPSDLPLSEFSNLKHLELKVCFNFQWLLVFQVLENSPGLEHLCIEEKKVGDSCWIEPKSVPSCIHSNLRSMKIKNCMGWKCDIQLLEYMLANAEVLTMLTITCESLTMKDELRFCPQLLKLPRASRFCEIHFVGKWLNSTRN